MTQDIREQAARMVAQFREKGEQIHSSLADTITKCCRIVEAESKRIMRSSTEGTYAGMGYSASNPAPDLIPPRVGQGIPSAGLLRASITHLIKQDGMSIEGWVGTDTEYAKYLEYGTSKMTPYPFLEIALNNKRQEVLSLLREVKGHING